MTAYSTLVVVNINFHRSTRNISFILFIVVYFKSETRYLTQSILIEPFKNKYKTYYCTFVLKESVLHS